MQLWRKAVRLVAVFFLITLGTSALVDLLPGSPAVSILGQHAAPEQIAELDHKYGFDQPLPVRYVQWLGGVLTGDFGESIRMRQPVTEALLDRLPVTVEIGVLAILLSLAIAVPAALYTAARQGGWLDRVCTAISSALMSIPSFVSAVLLVFLFALVVVPIFPVSGWAPLTEGLLENLRYAILPALSLSVIEIAVYYRVLRGDILATLQENFVLAGRARGLSRRYLLFRHVLRPSLFSLVTVAGLSFGRILGGSVIVESLFALPGLGNLAVQSIPSKDIPVIQGIVVVVAFAYVIINMGIDVVYAKLDPRVTAG